MGVNHWLLFSSGRKLQPSEMGHGVSDHK